VTFGMVVFLVVPYTAFTVYKEAVHEHSHYVQYPHMKVRHKAFPWAAHDCDFFDLACHKLAAKGVSDPFNAAKHHGDGGHGAASHAAHH